MTYALSITSSSSHQTLSKFSLTREANVATEWLSDSFKRLWIWKFDDIIKLKPVMLLNEW